MLLLGHRGAKLYKPENTIEAFETALVDGCDGFEFDVRLSADAAAIICHDPTVAGREISKSTCGELCHAAGRTIPVLRDVISGFAGRAFLDVELKVDGLERDIADLVEPSARVVASSF